MNRKIQLNEMSEVTELTKRGKAVEMSLITNVGIWNGSYNRRSTIN